ncbi:MAG: hypothetical protein LBV69_10290 [Bacteroidales bacterium]|jgi:hypothetical protein|nr:hypothetical protein [Bacteroidales bacterium]
MPENKKIILTEKEFLTNELLKDFQIFHVYAGSAVSKNKTCQVKTLYDITTKNQCPCIGSRLLLC